jgi:hypothetical protein
MRALLVVLLTACGSGGTGSDCRLKADCASNLFCSGPNDGPVCGIAPREGCESDATCNAQRCSAISDSCSADGVGSECREACTGDTQCEQGFRCDAGACVAILCNAGYTCPARQVCDPSRITASTPIYDRHHGCFDVTCTLDADCGERFCVNGICQDGPGACAEPMLVP